MIKGHGQPYLNLPKKEKETKGSFLCDFYLPFDSAVVGLSCEPVEICVRNLWKTLEVDLLTSIMGRIMI